MGNSVNPVQNLVETDSGSQAPALFKGIALFTPGGDLVYCIDPQKQNRWHLQLCLFLQELLGLTEPPHFLVPCFTATIDRWQDPRTQSIHTFAEAYPLVFQQQALLNVIFGCTGQEWQMASHHNELCDLLMLASYRQQFPQLWDSHELIARLEPIALTSPLQPDLASEHSWSMFPPDEMEGYVLRLFVSGRSAATERILKTLHHLLETHLNQPYTLKVIDVRKHPEQAEADQITATPTLVKVQPAPVRRIVGGLDNPALLLQALS